MFYVVPYALLSGGYAYVALRFAGSVPGPWATWVALAIAGLVPMFHLVAFRRRMRGLDDETTDRLAWVSYVLLGVLGVTFAASVVRDLGWLLATIVDVGLGWIGRGPLLPEAPEARAAVFAVLNLTTGLVAAAASVSSLVSARRVPPLRRVDVPVEGLDAALDGYTVAQLTDVHVGPTIKRDFVQRVVDATNAARPDLIAITGDLVDGSVEALRDDVAPLADLKAPDGVCFVTGNHEYYSGAEAWVDEVRRLGHRVLLNEHFVVRRGAAELTVAGVTDYSAGKMIAGHESDAAGALEGSDEDAYRLLLAHQPRSAEAAAAAGADLMLAGHTHGGQMWPWNHFVPLQQPYVAGLHRLGRLVVYVSRGTGYWGPPFRLLAPSEIALVTLRAV